MLCMLFPGQGSIEAGMGRDLLQEWPEAEDVYGRAEELCGIPLRELARCAPIDKLTSSETTQLLVFVQSVATLQVLRTAGVRAACVAGHSLGQWAATVAAGALPWERALTLVADRGRLMAEACRKHPGGMVALQVTGLSQAREILATCCQDSVLDVANVNGSHQVVLSGDSPAILRVIHEARRQRVGAVPLLVHGAFHTTLMKEAADSFRESVVRETFSSPHTPVVCGATGRLLSNGLELRQAMADQILLPVRWDLVMETLSQQGPRQFLEVGPGRVLSGLLLRQNRHAAVSWTNSGKALQRSLALGGEPA